MTTNLPAQTKIFCLNAKPFIEIFIAPKQIVIIHELTTYFSETINYSKSLNLEEKEKCEGMLTKAECLQALKSMNPEKTPGSDGLPIEFYKVFWNEISDCLLNTINYAYAEGKFSISQRRGIIKLIPKKDAEPYFVKNWRPITLLNTDYKIAAKAIANRLQNVLPKLINNDQTGFLKGRFIGENIRLTDVLINHTVACNIPGLLMFLDFEKAFDSCEWSFIWKTNAKCFQFRLVINKLD